jgi:hypothetical protein
MLSTASDDYKLALLQICLCVTPPMILNHRRRHIRKRNAATTGMKNLPNLKWRQVIHGTLGGCVIYVGTSQCGHAKLALNPLRLLRYLFVEVFAEFHVVMCVW